MVHERILQASARPTIGHLDSAFVGLMDEIKQLLQYTFQTSNSMTMPISAPGSAGMEACFVNLVEPGDQVIVCINGVFGHRMKENVERCGAKAIVVEDGWGSPVSLDKVRQAFINNPDASILAFVHAETSTGVLSDAKGLAQIAHDHGALVIVDAVTSLGGVPIRVDEWSLDAVYSGSQKCLSCFPGLSPVTFGEAALERIKNRKKKVQSWFLDLNLVMGYWSGEGKSAGRSYHHTAPVNSLYALHESLVMLHEEGIENTWSRHHANHKELAAGLEKLGLTLLVKETHRLPQLNAVNIPDGLIDGEIRALLLRDFELEIGGGLGDLAGKIWRIGLMGETCRSQNVNTCLNALGKVLGSESVTKVA